MKVRRDDCSSVWRPGDPHYADQLPLWTAGKLIPVAS